MENYNNDIEKWLKESAAKGKIPMEQADWEKMEALLDKKERRRPVAWFWIAASLVALITGLFFLLPALKKNTSGNIPVISENTTSPSRGSNSGTTENSSEHPEQNDAEHNRQAQSNHQSEATHTSPYSQPGQTNNSSQVLTEQPAGNGPKTHSDNPTQENKDPGLAKSPNGTPSTEKRQATEPFAAVRKTKNGKSKAKSRINIRNADGSEFEQTLGRTSTNKKPGVSSEDNGFAFTNTLIDRIPLVLETFDPLAQKVIKSSLPKNLHAENEKDDSQDNNYDMPSWVFLAGYRLGQADQGNNIPELEATKKFRIGERTSIDLSLAVSRLKRGDLQTYNNVFLTDTILGTTIVRTGSEIAYMQAKEGFGITPQVRINYRLLPRLDAFFSSGINHSRQDVYFLGSSQNDSDYYGPELNSILPISSINSSLFNPTVKINGRTTVFSGIGARYFIGKFFTLNANYNHNLYVVKNPYFESKKRSRGYLVVSLGVSF